MSKRSDGTLSNRPPLKKRRMNNDVSSSTNVKTEPPKEKVEINVQLKLPIMAKCRDGGKLQDFSNDYQVTYALNVYKNGEALIKITGYPNNVAPATVATYKLIRSYCSNYKLLFLVNKVECVHTHTYINLYLTITKV